MSYPESLSYKFHKFFRKLEKIALSFFPNELYERKLGVDDLFFACKAHFYFYFYFYFQ